MTQPIGVFDSGIGGLSVLKALRAALPSEHFIYIADSGHAPYGERDQKQVTARALAVTDYLVGKNIKALVVACNTATAAAVDLLRAAYPELTVIGVEPALKPAAATSRTGYVGVMATRGTLASDKFKALLQSQTAPVTFTLQPCDGLADAIERSALTQDTTKLIAICDQFIRAMGIFGTQIGQIDTLVLGCTHYSFAEPHLRQLLGPDVQIVETSHAVARQARRLVRRLDLRRTNPDPDSVGPGATTLLSTGSVQYLQAAAHVWLGLNQVPGHLHI